MPMQHTENFFCQKKKKKKKIFTGKILIHVQTGIFLNFAQNIDCGCTLEPPRQGGSNMYPQCIFWIRDKKNHKKFLLKILNFHN